MEDYSSPNGDRNQRSELFTFPPKTVYPKTTFLTTFPLPLPSPLHRRLFLFSFDIVFVVLTCRFIQFCIDYRGYRGCDFKPAAEVDQDLIDRLKRVHLDSKEALDAVETIVDEQPAWNRDEDY